MNPNPWIVEFAIREQRDRDARAQKLTDREGLITRQTNRPPRANQFLRAVGRLLMLLGDSLRRRAGMTSPVTERLDLAKGL